MKWYPLSTPPKESGKYLVGHRGTQFVTHYLHPEGSWAPNTRIGWQRDPRSIAATHWAKLVVPTDEQTAAHPRVKGDSFMDYREGMTVLFTEDKTFYRQVTKETVGSFLGFKIQRRTYKTVVVKIHAGERAKIIDISYAGEAAAREYEPAIKLQYGEDIIKLDHLTGYPVKLVV